MREAWFSPGDYVYLIHLAPTLSPWLETTKSKNWERSVAAVLSSLTLINEHVLYKCVVDDALAHIFRIKPKIYGPMLMLYKDLLETSLGRGRPQGIYGRRGWAHHFHVSCLLNAETATKKWSVALLVVSCKGDKIVLAFFQTVVRFWVLRPFDFRWHKNIALQYMWRECYSNKLL